MNFDVWISFYYYRRMELNVARKIWTDLCKIEGYGPYFYKCHNEIKEGPPN